MKTRRWAQGKAGGAWHLILDDEPVSRCQFRIQRPAELQVNINPDARVCPSCKRLAIRVGKGMEID